MDIKEFHYSEGDLKGSPNLIDDCKNHYIYINNLPAENDLDIIINGIQNFEDDISIIKQLPCVTADNLNSIICGIRKMREVTPVDNRNLFRHEFPNHLESLGFNLENIKTIFLKSDRFKNQLDSEIDIIDVLLSSFITWLNSSTNDVISLLLG